MTNAISDNRKSRGRPRVGATLIGVRLPPDQLAQLDAWIAARPEPMTRPEALREMLRLVVEGASSD